MSSVIFMDSEGNEKELPLSKINGVEDIANAYKDLRKKAKAKKSYISTKEDKLKSVKVYEPKNQEETN